MDTPRAAGARRESPGSRDAKGPERVTNRSRTRQFRKPVWVIQVRAGTAKGLAPAQARQYGEPRNTTGAHVTQPDDYGHDAQVGAE
jgi:hypothetical protein